MINDKGQKVYRKLLYYFDEKIWVHFTDLDNVFYNGLIIDLNEDKLTMVLKERVKGTIPILLECINLDSITPFKLSKEEWGLG